MCTQDGSGRVVRLADDRGELRVALAAAALLLAGLIRAPAQDCGWLSGEGLPGTYDSVWAATTWDPDGPGPEPELLIVAGLFAAAGDVAANNIAAWNGSGWQPLGAGIIGDGVEALTVYNGELIAGGYFTVAGDVECNGIARWDGIV